MHKLNDPTIFIAGPQRSGTTLLCNIVSAHHDIYISNEIPPISYNKPKKNFTKSEFVNYLSTAFYKKNGINISEFLLNKNKKLWGLKSPQLVYHLDQILTTLSQAKFLITIRDPRAYSSSIIRTKWGVANVYHAAHLWNVEIDIIERNKQKWDERILIIKYEDLVTDLQKTIKIICSFLNLENTADMPNYYKKESFIEKMESSKNVFSKPNKKFIFAWKQRLNNNQIEIIESICFNKMSRYGYQPINPQRNIRLIEKLYYSVHQKIIGEIQLQKRRSIWKEHNM